MKITDAKKFTAKVFQSHPISVGWVGGTGLGKTTLARELACELCLPLAYVPCRSEDALGLIIPNETRSGIQFIPSSTIKSAIDGPALLYIDEINRCDKYARAQLLELVGERTAGGEQLHSETRILITCNDESDDYDTSATDNALKTRFVAIPVTFDVETSIEYARARELHSMSLFIQNFSELLARPVAWDIKPNPRLLENLNLVRNLELNGNNDVMRFNLGEKYCKPFLIEEKNIFDTTKGFVF